LARTEADLLEAIATDSEHAEGSWEHVPGSKALSYSQLKAVWDGVNDQAKRLLGAFATHGGAMTQQDIMDTLEVDEPRLINGPLGGISRRVKKLLGDPEATFYSIHADDGRYVLQTETFEALCELIERERPELLSAESALRNTAHLETRSGNRDSDE
ncbi:MAG TPA: hypothetical protein VJ822_02690, partial [Dongiaceae bacterium]|nr:hypothetical protein [Dongiaceae bacterium]